MITAGGVSGCGVGGPHVLQAGALGALHTVLGGGGRAVVVMPCGSGKTLLGRWFVEGIGAELVVVLVPSLALVGQTLVAYRSVPGWAHASMVVCSDASSGHAVGLDEVGLPRWARERVGVSTSPRRVAEFVAGAGVRLVVGTYHSAPRLAAGLRIAGRVADVLVCDEAHRLTGRPRAEFRAVLDQRVLPACRRVFLTATPVEAGAWLADRAESGSEWDPGGVLGDDVLFLDDVATFGETVYRASFADAVAHGLLVDYDVQVLATDPGRSGSGLAGGPVDAVLAAAGEGARRILTFHSRISHARALARALDGAVLAGGRVVRAEYLESRHRGEHRRAALDRLAAPGRGEVRVLASARVLTEGVDVPAVDTVVFAEPRSSAVDIVQAVGRAMRRAPGKSRGRIVLPVTLEQRAAGLDADTELAATAWRGVWMVLRALACMDPRFGRALSGRANRGAELRVGRCGPRGGPGVVLEFPEGVDRRWWLRALDRTGAGWWHHLELLRACAAEQGHARPGRAVVREGVALGSWVARQRTMYRNGLLDPGQIHALEALPGWAWTEADVAWWHAAAQWVEYHEHARQRGESARWWAELTCQPAYPRHHPRTRCAYRNLAEFALDTCARHRRRELPNFLVRAAAGLAGWCWELVDAQDAVMVDALVEYAAWKHTFNPEHAYRHDDGLPLGAWLTALRRRRFTGRLAPALAGELALIQRRQPGAARLRWERAATSWRLGYLALRQYVAREGRARMPYEHREALPDYELDLSRWCVVQRHDYRRGVLAPERAEALERVPGWAWEIPLREGYRPALPDGEHGSRAAYARGCRCAACTVANRGYETQRQARRALGEPTTDLVDASWARGHVRILLGRGATGKGLARAAGLNVKTITEVENGTLARVRPETETAILDLTLAAERAAALPGARVDGARTWALLEDLITLGWPKAWIARELGHTSGLQLSRDQVLAGTAEKVADLHRRLGRRRPPPRRPRQALPLLAQILASDPTPCAANAPIGVAAGGAG